MASRPVCTSPLISPVLPICSLSRAITFPSTLPRTIISRATRSALMFPFGPMVKEQSAARFSFPSTKPSTKRSSVPVTSPLILMPWPILAAEREESGNELEESKLGDFPNAEAAEEFSATPWDFASSFFHIGHLDIENGIFEVAHRRAGREAATQKSEHNTVLRACKQERQIVNVVCFLNNYPKDGGFSALSSTIPCVVGDSVGDLSSQIVTIIPAISRIKTLADLRFSHQFPGSKSPSRALATSISISCGKTWRKM